MQTWIKHEGDAVAKGEVVLEVETDKAVHEVEAEAEGVLRRIYVEEGEEVPVTAVIAVIADEGEDVPDAPPDGLDTAPGAAPATVPAPAPPPADRHAPPPPDRGAVVMRSSRPSGARRQRWVPPVASAGMGQLSTTCPPSSTARGAGAVSATVPPRQVTQATTGWPVTG